MLKKLFKGMLLPVVCTALTLNAAEVGSVKFIQEGGNPIPTDLLNVALRLRPGMEFSKAHMDEDLKNLIKTGKVSDAVAEFQTMPDGKIEIIYRIKPSPVISLFRIEGNKKFDTKDLQDSLLIADGASTEAELIVEKNRNGKIGTVKLNFYPSKMYFEAAPPVNREYGPGGGE